MGSEMCIRDSYSPMITNPEADLPQAQSIFPAAVCGADGMQITLQYEEA